jgi:hypothetical protein
LPRAQAAFTDQEPDATSSAIMSVSDDKSGKPPSDDDEEDDRDRRATNILLLCFGVLIIGAGIWLVDALIAARKADECMSAGRRNCAPVEAPVAR